MILLYFLFIPIFYVPIKLFLYFLTLRFGKISYDNFSAFGFTYNSKKDLFYSSKNAWQRQFGYCHLYDVGAPLFRMIIDTEPVKFYYNNKNWLICFWKGQYGIVTGAEVGIYATNQKEINKNTLYLPVKDDDMLDMSITLYKNGIKLAEDSQKHWWLTIFKLGYYSKPKELSVDIIINFKDQEMLRAFLLAFKKLKYKDSDYVVNNNTFSFTFKKPHTRKVWTRTFITDKIIGYLNHRNVKLYNNYLADLIDDNTNNNKKLINVNNMIPSILKNNDSLYLNNEILKWDIS